MKISIGSDHRGFALKHYLQHHDQDITWVDVGTFDTQRTDYPIYARRVTHNIIENVTDQGILICGSGIGMTIAANRHPGIFAALCWNPIIARQARADDNANILVLPADHLSPEEVSAIFTAWRSTPFKGGSYQQRLALIDGE